MNRLEYEEGVLSLIRAKERYQRKVVTVTRWRQVSQENGKPDSEVALREREKLRAKRQEINARIRAFNCQVRQSRASGELK